MAERIRVKASLRLVREGKLLGRARGAVARGRRGTGIPAAQRRTHGDELDSKAWSVVHACEEQLGFALLERRIGGAGGGGASLTEKDARFWRGTVRSTDRHMRCSTRWRRNILRICWGRSELEC